MQADSPEEEELRLTLNSLSSELHKLDDIHWICPLMQCLEEVSEEHPQLMEPPLRLAGSCPERTCVCVSGVGAEQQQEQQHEAEDHPQSEEGAGEAAQAEVQQLPLR